MAMLGVSAWFALAYLRKRRIPTDPWLLRAIVDGDGLRLEVENHGPAIDAAVRAQIFEPFFTTREKGTGLGLALVQETVAAHGGTVEVTCADGRTTFAIRLPAAAA